MFVVVNIQKEEHVLDLVKLLFQNGFPSVGVCDSLEDACPKCNADSSVTNLKGTHLEQKDSPAKVKSRKRKATEDIRRSVSTPRARKEPTSSATKEQNINVSIESDGPAFDNYDFDEEMVAHGDEVLPTETDGDIAQPSRSNGSIVSPTKKVISPPRLELPARRSRRNECFAEMKAKLGNRKDSNYVEGSVQPSRSVRNPYAKQYISTQKLELSSRTGRSRRQECFAAITAQRNKIKVEIEEESAHNSATVAVYGDDDEELIEDVQNTSDEARYDGDTSLDLDMDTMDLKPDIKNTIWKNGEIRETVQCQMCNRKIIRLHQKNFINHLSRHCRLHASKQQFGCGICGLSITRRYEVTKHIEQVHPEVISPRLHIVDKGAELRDEYIALLDKCFPGMRGDRAGIREYKDATNTRQEASHGENVYLSDSS